MFPSTVYNLEVAVAWSPEIRCLAQAWDSRISWKIKHFESLWKTADAGCAKWRDHVALILSACLFCSYCYVSVCSNWLLSNSNQDTWRVWFSKVTWSLRQNSITVPERIKTSDWKQAWARLISPSHFHLKYVHILGRFMVIIFNNYQQKSRILYIQDASHSW